MSLVRGAAFTIGAALLAELLARELTGKSLVGSAGGSALDLLRRLRVRSVVELGEVVETDSGGRFVRLSDPFSGGDSCVDAKTGALVPPANCGIFTVVEPPPKTDDSLTGDSDSGRL